jgi:hypothetical protein
VLNSFRDDLRPLVLQIYQFVPKRIQVKWIGFRGKTASGGNDAGFKQLEPSSLRMGKWQQADYEVGTMPTPVRRYKP